MRALSAALLLALLAPAAAGAHEPDPWSGPPCYETAIVGRRIGVISFTPASAPFPEGDDKVYLGGRTGLRLRVELASGRDIPGEIANVEAMMGELLVRDTPMLFFVQRLKDGRQFAIKWEPISPDWMGRFDVRGDDPPQRCGGKFKPIRDLPPRR